MNHAKFIKCNNVTINYSWNIVIKNINLHVKSPSIVIIKGSNGKGKSSLLKAIAGLNSSHTGTILKTESLFLGHKLACKNKLKVIENMEMWHSWYKSDKDLISKSIRSLGLQNITQMKFENLSCGWQKRVAISRVVIGDKAIWLLDEPFTHLDTEGRNLLYNLIIDKYKQSGIIMLTTNQDIDFDVQCQTINL